MKYKSTLSGKIYDYTPEKKRTTCPECSHNRRKTNDPCVSWNKEDNIGYCHHCNTTFFEYEAKPDKPFVVPVWRNITSVTDKAVKFFNSRGIKQETLNDLQVYSDIEYMPQFEKKVPVICFPYFMDESLLNVKYRGPEKSFKLVKDARLIFWNIDSISSDVIIVEGEIDLLSFYEAGFRAVISVPNGANNLDYLDSLISKFENVEDIYLAVDNDKKGYELREELARRLGQERCKIVDFKECKDANEFLVKYGAVALTEQVANSTNYPVKGIVKVGDIYSDIKNLFETGMQKGKDLQMDDVDQFITWETGRLATVTGIPSHGKSEFVDFIITRLNVIYGWKTAYFTPENYPLKYHYAKLYEKFIGKKFESAISSSDEFNIAYEYIRDNFFYIMDEDDSSVDTILKNAKQLVKTKGIKVLVIDPYNKLEHNIGRGETETQYISKFLDKITSFSKLNDVLIFLIAHPVKMQKGANGLYNVPSLYDISGSANFFNKTDYGLTVYRNYDKDGNTYDNTIDLYIQKVKFKNLGSNGVAKLKYNYNNGRFEGDDSDINNWDNTNWLIN